MFHAQGSPVRDGRSYLQRIEAFNDCTSIAEQNKIQIQLANSNLVSGRKCQWTVGRIRRAQDVDP
eukprot:7124661-Prymnesium_polylepis.1